MINKVNLHPSSAATVYQMKSGESFIHPELINFSLLAYEIRE